MICRNCQSSIREQDGTWRHTNGKIFCRDLRATPDPMAQGKEAGITPTMISYVGASGYHNLFGTVAHMVGSMVRIHAVESTPAGRDVAVFEGEVVSVGQRKDYNTSTSHTGFQLVDVDAIDIKVDRYRDSEAPTRGKWGTMSLSFDQIILIEVL